MEAWSGINSHLLLDASKGQTDLNSVGACIPLERILREHAKNGLCKQDEKQLHIYSSMPAGTEGCASRWPIQSSGDGQAMLSNITS